MNPIKEYNKKSHKILKTYNSILVKCKNIPILSDKNIVIIENMDSIVNAQIETRKPILYFQELESISFILLDGTEAYIYILKANKNITTELEHTINNYEIARKTFVKEILSKIEKILLDGNMEKEKLLTSNKLEYLENIKEDGLQEKDTNTEKSNIEEETKKQDKENDSTNNMYLVPIKKKKIKIFNKKKKAKRAKEKSESRRRIG